MRHIKKAVILFTIFIIAVSFTIYRGKQEVIQAPGYPEMFGLEGFDAINQVERDIGPPVRTATMNDNILWCYDQFEIMFFASGRFRSIKITGSDYYFKSEDCRVGCTAEVVKQTYQDCEALYTDRNHNLVCKDGEYYIRFMINNERVDAVYIAGDDI